MKRTVMNRIARTADMSYQAVRERCNGFTLDDLLMIEEILLNGGDFHEMVDQIDPPNKLDAPTGILIAVVMCSTILGILASVVVVWAR